MAKKENIRTIVADDSGVNVANATKTGYLYCPVGGVFCMSYPSSKLRRGRVQGGGYVSPTLMVGGTGMNWVLDSITEMENGKKVRVRKLTERETFRLMGLSDDSIDRLMDSDISSTALYRMAGNSIVVDVLEAIFKSLLIEPAPSSAKAQTLF